MENKKRAIIVDLDGTLCNNKHRQKYIDGSIKPKNWDMFFQELTHDLPNDWCTLILRSLVSKYDLEIIYVTGRSEKYRKATTEWFENKCLYSLIVDKIFMRKNEDFREDYEIKEEIYLNEIKPHYDILFCIDDRQQVVDMWRKNGLTCLQCAEGNF